MVNVCGVWRCCIRSTKGGFSLEDYRLQPAPQAQLPQRGSRWLLVGGVALVLALTLGVGALFGSALLGGTAQAAGNANQAQSTSNVGQPQAANFSPGNVDNLGRGFAGTPGPGGPGGQGQCVTLTVSSISGSTILAKAADGSTVTIHTTSSTKYTKNHQTAAASDVTVGSKISVMGTKNSDGSITATSIDILS